MFCRKCGNQIDNRASVCPECGTPTNGGRYAKAAPKKKKHPVLLTVLVVVVVALVVAGFSGGDSQNKGPQKVSSANTVAPQPEQAAPSAQTEAAVQTVPTTAAAPTESGAFTVGDSAVMDGVTVTLKSITENTGANYSTPTEGNVFLICEFEIQNGSDQGINVSSMLSFEAYVDDYSVDMSLLATSAASVKQLDGSVAVGKKISGAVGYEVPSDWQNMEIRYVPNPFLDDAIIFTYSK